MLIRMSRFYKSFGAGVEGPTSLSLGKFGNRKPHCVRHFPPITPSRDPAHGSPFCLPYHGESRQSTAT